MFSLSKTFTTSVLKLAVLDDISPKYWEKVTSEVDILTNRLLLHLGPQRANALDKLNSAPVGQPIFIDRLTLDFWQLNWDYLIQTEGEFNTFNEVYSAENAIEINLQTIEVIKHEPISLQSIALFKPFTVDVIGELLTRLKLENFLIRLGNSYLSRGREKWEIEFEHPYINDVISTVISEEAAVLAVKPVLGEGKNEGNPFAAKSDTLAILAESGTVTHAHVVSELALKVYLNSELQRLSNRWSVGLTVFDQSGVYRQFQPSLPS